MDDNEYRVNKELLNTIRQNCKEKQEETLQYYCECLLKMYTAYYKINQTEMLSYIRQIMAPALPLVVTCFKEMADIYLKADSKGKKTFILRDITESIVELGNVFETIIHATNGADRIVFQTAPINIGLKYAAPKLCAYYSSLLNRLAHILMDETKIEYAFCVYPTLNSQSEAVILFMERQKSGKVGVIRVPGKDIAEVEKLRFWQTHELFHILPGNCRFRKQRAFDYLRILLYSFGEDLIGELKDLTFDEKEKLRMFLFDEVKNNISARCRELEDNNRSFYSNELKEYYVNELQTQFWEIINKTAKNVFEYMFWEEAMMSFEAYKKYMERAEAMKHHITKQLYLILAHGDVKHKCTFYMEIFREVYADLFSIITLQTKPQQYLTWLNGKSDADVGENSRVLLMLRVYFVAEIMSDVTLPLTVTQQRLFQQWEEWKTTQGDAKFESFSDLLQQNQRTPLVEQNEQRSTGIFVNKAIIDAYKKYFVDCCKKHLEFEQEHPQEFGEFRERYAINDAISAIDIFEFIGKRKWEQILEEMS